MTTSRPTRAGRPGRGWKGLGLVAVALVALGLDGCASFGGGRLGLGNPCGGGCATGKCGRGGKCSLSRLFHRRATAVAVDPGCVEPGCGEPGLGMPMETIDGGMIAPAAPLGAPAPPADLNPDLSPIQSAPAAGETGANTKARKPAYQSLNSRPLGGAQEARREAGLAPSPSADDPLAGIAALSVPNQAAEPEVSPPVPPAAIDRMPGGLPPAADDLPEMPGTAASGVAPGIRRFKVVEPRLAAGSLPTDAGWKWLVGLGYKTVLDLREAPEVKQEELAAIAHHGLRYVAMPASKTAVDAARVREFEAAIAKEDARPIFVFDDDGVRPASFTFLHMVLTQKKERRLAEREVEELGAADTALWKSTLGYLATSPGATVDGASRVLPISLDVRPDDDSVGLAMLPSAISAPAPAVETPASWTPYASAILGELGTALMNGSQALANRPARGTPAAAAPGASGG